jgi:hypothetical protein
MPLMRSDGSDDQPAAGAAMVEALKDERFCEAGTSWQAKEHGW